MRADLVALVADRGFAVELALFAVAEPRLYAVELMLFVAGFEVKIGGTTRAVLPFPSGRRGGRVRVMLSPQSLSEADRRTVAAWAADCAERVLPIFEAEAPSDDRPRDGIARARAFSRGELDAAGEIRRRFVAGRAAQAVASPAAKAAARAAGQAAGVAHMGAHAFGAAAYAVKAVSLSGDPDDIDRLVDAETAWQIDQLTPDVAEALVRLPALGSDGAGPLGAGLLASGELGRHIRHLQSAVAGMAGRAGVAGQASLQGILARLNALDPYGLRPGLDGGAPVDDYLPEARELKELFCEKGALTGGDVDEVWQKWFNEPLSERITTEKRDRFVHELLRLLHV